MLPTPLIAYPIISRYGLSRLRCVNITIGGTAVTVTLALIILAVIGGMFKGTVDGWFWVFLVAKVAFLGFLIVFFFPVSDVGSSGSTMTA